MGISGILNISFIVMHSSITVRHENGRVDWVFYWKVVKERGQIPSYMIVSQCKLHHTNSNILSVRMENISQRKNPIFLRYFVWQSCN